MLTADRTAGVPLQPQFTLLRLPHIKEQQTADQALAAADDKLDGFRGLNSANNARQHTDHAAFRAGGHQPRRRWLGIKAAVAGPLPGIKNAGLPFKLEDGAVDQRLTQ